MYNVQPPKDNAAFFVKVKERRIHVGRGRKTNYADKRRTSRTTAKVNFRKGD